MDSTPTQDANQLHHRLNEMETKMHLLERVSSDILTSINTLAENTKEAYLELQNLKAIPAQNTLLQLQEQAPQEPANIPVDTEVILEDIKKEPETPLNEEASHVEETEE
jgi:hypothetical protein